MSEAEITEPQITKAVFEPGKYFTFTLGNESYGISVIKIREIIGVTNITPVPQLPHYMKGVINLRGKVIPVMDMRLKFDLGNGDINERTCIVVVQIDSEEIPQTSVALIVDAVEEVVTITNEEVEETPDFGSSFDGEYIMAIAKIKGEVKTLLDIDRVVLEDVVIQANSM